MKRAVTEHPDLESIAAYLEGRLSDHARARLTEHLSACEDCYTVFAESALTRVDVETQRESIGDRVSAWFTAPRLAWSVGGTALAAAASVLLVAGYGRMMSPHAEAELQALVAAVGTERTFEPRLTGGFAYGPVKVTRGVVSEASPDVRIAAATIEKASADRRSPASLDALGIAYLVTGKEAEAIAAFEGATRDAPQEARYWSDLAAAYLVRAARAHQQQEYSKALTMADRAVKADPKLVEAWFNRAVAVTNVSSATEARHAWEDYLRVDANSPWASEANDHLRSLNDSSR